jgi:uncharacterized protein YceH (UPF0502 family)
MVLTEEEIRVLGVLMEKDMATPEYYPLSLNALVTACNQKTNRDPIVSYDDDTVHAALDSMKAKQLIMVQSGGRVVKYSHRASELLNINNRELAVLAVLMLRGAQTLNEVKMRAEPLHHFDDMESVEAVLRRLAERGMALFIEKRPGMREPRWTHLMAGEPVMPVERAEGGAHASAGPAAPGLADRVARLEAEVEALRAEIAELRQLFQ